MFDLGTFLAGDGSIAPIAMLTSSKSCDDTVSTLSMSSESIFGSSRNVHRRTEHQRNNKRRHKSIQRNCNAFSSDDMYDKSKKVNVPPKIAFQMFELIELQRRCKGVYKRHQEKLRQSVLKTNTSVYQSEFESCCIDGELFV